MGRGTSWTLLFPRPILTLTTSSSADDDVDGETSQEGKIAMDSQPNRKLLDRLLRSEDVRRQHRDLMTKRTARRFVEGIRDHNDPMDVLFQLDKRDPRLVRTIFTLESSNDFMDQVVMVSRFFLPSDRVLSSLAELKNANDSLPRHQAWRLPTKKRRK